MKMQVFLRQAAGIFGIALIGVGIAAQPHAGQQSSDELALAVADAQRANQKAMTKYSWRVKSEISLKGESKATSLTEMRFGSDGKIQATNIGGETSIEKKRGLRGRRQEKKIEDFAQYLEGVLDHSFQYIFLSKGALVDIFDRAKITQSDTSIDISAGDLFVKGDELFLSVNPTTKLPMKLTFKTTLDDDTIQGAVTLQARENGPSTPASFEFDIPTKEVKITSETYDWVEQK